MKKIYPLFFILALLACQQGKYSDLIKNGKRILSAETEFIQDIKPLLDKDKNKIKDQVRSRLKKFNEEMKGLFDEYDQVRKKHEGEKLLENEDIHEISQELKKTSNALFDILGKFKVDYLKDREMMDLIKQNDIIYNRKW